MHRRQWNARLYSLQFEADVAPFKAGQFVRVGLDVEGERVSRPYSLVNAPHEQPAEIYFNLVPEGPLSPRLAALDPGDTLSVHSRANGYLILEGLPPVPHLWLLATGTAIGPFLSILKTKDPWRAFERVVLAHAVRTRDELTYAESVGQFRREHPEQFRFVPFVSRETVPGAICGRIPAAIEAGQLEDQVGCEISATRSHVMLCGNSGMIQDTVRVLAQRGMKRHTRREAGHISAEIYH